MQLFGLAIKRSRLFSKFWFGRGDQPEKIFCFLGLLHAAANRVSKILLRNAFIRLTIIRPNTRTASDNLTNQSIVSWTPRNLLGESDDCFSERPSALLQVERMPFRAMATRYLKHPQLRSLATWRLVFGDSLELGCWSLELH